MPLLPYISDTTEHLNLLFQSFKNAGAHYVMPSALSLFGTERADSRGMVFRAIEKYYPHLLPKYKKWFGEQDYPPEFYQNAFSLKMKELSANFKLPLQIINS